MEIVWLNPQAYEYFGSSLTLEAEVDVFGEELLFHIFNESQFVVWEKNHGENRSLLSELVLDEREFSLELEAANGRHHFVLENPSNITRNALLSLLVAGDFLRFDYVSMPLYIVLVVAGITTCVIMFRGEISSRFDEFLKLWSKPIYWKKEEDADEVQLRFESILSYKRFTKYFVLTISCAIAVGLLYRVFLVTNFIETWLPLGSKYKIYMIDVATRDVTLKVLFLLPLLLSIPVILIFLSPREEDLSDMVKSFSGFRKRRSEKQLLIRKHVFRKIVTATFSFRFLFFCALLVLTALLIRYSPFAEMQIVQAALFTSFAFTMGIWGSYTLWSGFQAACRENGIGKYAAERYMKSNIIEFVVVFSTTTIYLTMLLQFTISDFWISTIKSIVLEPVRGVKSLPFIVGELEAPQFTFMVVIFSVVLAVLLVGFLLFVLFPYLDGMGPRGVLGVLLVFILTYITEHSIMWILQGSMSDVIHPIGIIAPIIASIMSWFAQDRYKKMIRKRLS